MFISVSYISTVKVVKFNRRRPLPDVQNEDFVSQNYGDAPGSLSITGYRSVLRHSSSLWIIVITVLYFLCSCLCACFFKSIMFCGRERLGKMLQRYCEVHSPPPPPPRDILFRPCLPRCFRSHSVTGPSPERYSVSPLLLPEFLLTFRDPPTPWEVLCVAFVFAIRSPFISVNNNCHSGNNYVAWKPETDTIALPFGR